MDQLSKYIQSYYAWLVGAAVTIILWGLSHLITKQRAKKAFTYCVVANTSLIRRRDGVKGKIEFLYESTPVDSVYLVEIELRNAGATQLDAKDFEEPVQIVFPVGTDLYEPEVIYSSPDEFKPTIEQEKHCIKIVPKLMNSGDLFVVKVLVTAQSAIEPTVTARISGVRRLTKIDRILLSSDDDKRAATLLQVSLTSGALIGVLLCDALMTLGMKSSSLVLIVLIIMGVMSMVLSRVGRPSYLPDRK